jgi:subtilisin family serine protease
VHWLTGRRRLLALGVVGVVLWVVLGVVAFGDGGSPPASDRDDPLVAEVLSDEELELIHGAEPDPACASAPAAAPGDSELVAVGVVRVEGTCLDATTEYVPADEVDARLAGLDDDPAVVAAAPAPPPATSSQEDDRRRDQWALDMLGVDEGSSELPWPDGTGVVVAVLDSGIHADHEDLGDAVVERRPGPDVTDLDPTGHGTAVAGIVAARRGNGGMVGIAPPATILDVPIQVAGAEQNPDWWAVALPWAVNRGADVANMSFHGSRDDYDEDQYKVAMAVVEFARANDVVAVAGGGNCGGSCPEPGGVPSGLPGVVTVGAVQKDRDLAGYSARTDEIDLVAPGGGELRDQIVTTSKNGDHDGDFNGTSAAAPHVAAAAAVMRSAVPRAGGDEIARALIDTADPGGVSEQDRDDVGAGDGLVDIVAAIEQLRTAHPPEDPADRTQAAFVRDDTLVALDGDVAEPVRHVDPGAPLSWLEWSNDHTRLVGLAGSTLFSWAGPGTEPPEVDYQVPCEACGPSLTYLDDSSEPVEEGTGDVVVSLDYDGTLTHYDAATLEELGTAALSFPSDAPGTMTLLGDVGGRLVVHESGGAHASERLWLVDPASREAETAHEVAAGVSGRVVVNAADDRIAFVDGYDACSSDNHVHVLDGGDLSEIADVGTPSGPDNPTGMKVDELFFNGDVLYATMTHLSSGGPGPCEAGSAGVWRLAGEGWEQVRSERLANARPLEGRTGDEPTGWLTIETDGRASLRPIQPDDISLGDLEVLEPELWATPTRTEIDFDSGHPADGSGSGQVEGEGGGRAPSNDSEDDEGEGGGAPQTVEAAVTRFEEYAHAFGDGDVTTACAIGRPAVEAGGLGLSCEQAIAILREMIPADYLAALREVEVDPTQAEQTAPDRVVIPPAYPYSTEPESDPPVILEHDGTDWFVVP